ncbi:MAG: EAL domain-containing protein [Magnetococcales bacterium]|nr:EAL domain-containing protein [Magnetococcales bacterium]
MSILLLSLLIIPAGMTFLNHLEQEEGTIQRELQGISQVRQLNAGITFLQHLRGLNQMALRAPATDSTTKLLELESDFSALLVALQKDLASDPFQIGVEINRFQGWLGNIIHPQGPLQIPYIIFEKQTAMIQRIADLRRLIMLRSHLALDVDQESSFLTKLVLEELPELEESIGRVRGLGSGLLVQSTPSMAAKMQFEMRIGGIRTIWEQIVSSQHVIQSSLPSLQGSLACLQKQARPELQHFLDLGAAFSRDQQAATQATQFFALGTQAMAATKACADSIQTKLLERFDARLARLQTLRTTVIVATSLLWLLVTAFELLSYRLHQRAFAQVVASEQKNQAILEAAVDGILTIDGHGIIQSANSAAEEIFGYPSGSLIGLNVSVLMASPHRELHDSYIQSYLATGTKRVIGYGREVEGVCQDGGRFPLELAVGEFKSDGKSYFTGILHDITERKRAKEALQEAYNELEHRVLERTQELQATNAQLIASLEAQQQAESNLRLAAKVFEHASEAIVITDTRGSIVEVNNAYSTITGFGREEVLGANPRIGRSGRHDAAFYQAMWQAITTTGQWSGEVWDRRKNGEIYPKWLTINAVKNHKGETTHFVGIFSDISHIKTTEERLEQLAFYDPLTRLPNRMLFKDRAKRAMEQATRHHKRGAIFFIDLDRFKHVNDTLGHAAGDALLIEVSRRLRACVRASDTVARLGGDEFTVILVDLDQGEEAATVAQKIVAAVAKPVELEGHQANIGASIGIAIFPDDGNSYESITQYADVAMYHAKESGRGTYRFFEAGMNAKSSQRAIMESNFHSGLQNRHFILHYQPKVELTSGRLIGMEGLVRWQQPDGTMISPMDFIPLAEETGLIVPLGQQILRLACAYNKRLLASGSPPLRVAVNLSGRQFQDKSLHASIQAALEESGLPPEYLELEVTESMMMKDERQAIVILKRLRDIGLSIAMDDFGTGYSSLSYLKRFPINSLKIDQSFVRELKVDSDDAAIVSAIVSMAKSLRLHVVAEGVENQSQFDFLKNLDCNEVQGYLISRPLKESAFTRFLKEWPPQ